MFSGLFSIHDHYFCVNKCSVFKEVICKIGYLKNPDGYPKYPDGYINRKKLSSQNSQMKVGIELLGQLKIKITQTTLREDPENARRTLREHSENTQGTLREH